MPGLPALKQTERFRFNADTHASALRTTMPVTNSTPLTGEPS